jgi:putative transcriptional regulator
MKRHWLRRIRLNQKMTQKELSEKAKINRSFYTQIENGTRSPSPYTAQRIAAALGIDWTIFFTIDCGVTQQERVGEQLEASRKNHHTA